MDLPSGYWGGGHKNPLQALSQIVASLHDPATNRVALEGFYENVRDLTDEELAELPDLDEEAEAKMLGISECIREEGYSTYESKTVRPTLELTGIYGGYSGEGSKTVLPADAHAKIVFRLVAGQVPDDVFRSLEEHIARVSPELAPGLRLEVQRLNPGARAYESPRDSPAFELARRELTRLFGTEPTLRRVGGSVNAFADFHDILGIQSISYGFGAPDSFQHAPDERMRLYSLHLGQRAYVSLILKAARLYGGAAAHGDEL